MSLIWDTSLPKGAFICTNCHAWKERTFPGGGGLEPRSLVAEMEERWGNQKNNLVAGPQFGDSVLSLIPWTWSKIEKEGLQIKALRTKRLV